MLIRCLVAVSVVLCSPCVAAAAASISLRPVPPAGETGPFLWPQPKTITTGTTSFYISPSAFSITYSPNFDLGAHLLGAASNRFRLFTFPYTTNNYIPTDTTGEINSVYVNIKQNTNILNYDTIEHYNLTITASGAARIDAENCFGAMYGLQTLSQLIEYSSTPEPHYKMPYGPVKIIDAPRFGWRGLMIDTSRHFLSIATIQRTIIAMHLNKLNTLHWHISDAYSFPLQSTKFPELTKDGAYDQGAVYSQADVQGLISFGHDRGVRVLPEFDVPGHAAGMAQWNHTLAACPQFLNAGFPGVETVALDPTSNWTYTFLREFLNEQAQVFPADFFHLGGNDIREECFDPLYANPTIVTWMKQTNTTFAGVIDYFWTQMFKHVIPTLTAQGITPTLWAGADWRFNPAINVSLVPIYQVYETQETLRNVTLAGYNAINSAGWILNADEEGSLTAWEELYAVDPQNATHFKNATYRSYVLGGEAILWGSEASDFSIDTILWPRVSAVAERLWSPAPASMDLIDWNVTQWRLDVQACRMSRRRIRAAPSMPGFCAFANDYVAPTWPQVGLSYVSFYSLITLSVIGGLYLLAVIVKQIAVVRAASSAKKASVQSSEQEALLA